MLTTVILDGEMGKLFGREHRLNIKSPKQALRLINANVGGLKNWIINNAPKFNAYRVICEYRDGRKEALNDDTFDTSRGKLKSVRFVPTIMGAGGAVKAIVGVTLMVVASFLTGGMAMFLMSAGMGLAMAGVTEMLAPKPKKGEKKDEEKSDSHYFSGAENTSDQGSPVPLIYGRIRTGAQAISASLTIDQLK